MSKRAAADELPDGSSPLKRPHLDHEPEDDDASTAHTPASSDYASSPVTTVTTPRAKFPSDLKTLACTWPGCSKTFNRPARLRDHLNAHTNSRPFKCPYDDCDKDYTVDKHLKQHIIAVHTQERKHVCQREGCGKSFVTGTRLKRHQAVHEGADRFRCQDCGQSFRKKDTLAKHVRTEHQGQRAHPCAEPGCDAAFDTKTSLRRHHEREHGEARFWCGECGNPGDGEAPRRVGFTTEVLLQAHIKREHQNCMFCEYKSSTHGDLERHVEMYHSGKSVEDRKTHVCPVPGCGKKFTRQSNCNNHVRTAHNGLRFICGEVDVTATPGLEGWTNDQGCGGAFRAKARLEDHIRHLHLGQERVKRAPVKKELDDMDILNEITGVTAAQVSATAASCPFCPERFIRHADLDTHIANLHDIVNDNTGLFGQDHESWAEDMAEYDIFAADIDNGPLDEWAEDEVNILMLARDPSDDLVDPSLTGS